ncbi:coiled-coil domain-containing protein 117 isoform X2 [Hemicordylus capensis]|uniref:coiled-coil domain-containing protein 117 isoform X2 n=1 Tax=Hemicordylus capensis TaxID=884348 RepID=UPI002303F7D2|nr:coiled-coil domain-containing protein 117 isoform X2 [Hemicordylus capensis]
MPSQGPASLRVFCGSEKGNKEPGRIPLRAPLLLGGRKKHKLEEEEEEDCPASKRRPTAAALTADRGEQWLLAPAGAAQGGRCLPGTPAMLEAPCEDMEQAVAEQPGEAARRTLQEIEDRITDDDEDAAVERSGSHLPTLVLSDTLKTGLKRGYEEALTKKIIESMSRPSMELVLWKPLPELLTETSKSVSLKSYKPQAEEGSAQPGPLRPAFCPLTTETFSVPPPPPPPPVEMPSDLYGAVGPPGGSEEEMEL